MRYNETARETARETALNVLTDNGVREFIAHCLEEPLLGFSGCPSCCAAGVAGATPALARARAPKLYAAWMAPREDAPIPNAPLALCWDCRAVYAAG